MKKQSFLTGAVILMIANAISKILGAVLKIPLAYILKEEGMAVYNIAFEVYIMFLAFIISGFPFAVSKLTAEASSKGLIRRERKIVSVSTVMLVIIGAIGTLALYFMAPFFALAMKEEKAVYAIRMLSPAIFFVALGTGYKSYFQGVSYMIPTAISQVAEAFIKLAAGYGLAVFFVNYGVEKTAGGAIMGVTIGEFAATAILMGAYLFTKKEKYDTIDDEQGIVRQLLSMALPLLLASVVSNAINIADTTLVRSRLLDAGFSNDDARFLYGAYTGYALTVFHLPIGILATLGVSILPVIAGAYASGDGRKAQKAAYMGIRISLVLAVPCAVMMYTMSHEILYVLFRNDTSAKMLSAIAPCAIMMCVSQMSAAILQSAGKIMTPFYNSLAGSAVKLILSYIWIGMPEINIYGSAYSSSAAFTVVMILNLISIYKYLGLKKDIMAIIIKPVICGAAMLTAIMTLYPYIEGITGPMVRVLAAAGIGGGIYALLLFLTGTVSVKEWEIMLVKNEAG